MDVSNSTPKFTKPRYIFHSSLPHNGDASPKVMVYFIDSQFINLFLLFETIFLKMHSLSREKPALWVNDIVAKVSKTKFFKFMIVSDQSGSADPNIRHSFRAVLDNFFICFIAFIYIFMFKKLMPDSQQ